MLNRLYGYLVSALLIGAALYPAQVNPPLDSLPLSTHPILARSRPRVAGLKHVVAHHRDGTTSVLPSALVADGDGLAAEVLLHHTLQRGKRAVHELCEQLAQRVAHDQRYGSVARLEIRDDLYQVLGYFSSSRKPMRSRLLARCSVPRRP